MGYCSLSEVCLVYSAFQKPAVSLSSVSDESNIKLVLLDQFNDAGL